MYLSDLKAKYPPATLLRWLDACAHLRPLVIGEAIIDEYVFTETLGTSSKVPALAVQQMGGEQHQGGSLAIARHLAGLCDAPVSLVAQRPPVVKTRVWDRYTRTTLLEIYQMDDTPTQGGAEIELNDALIDQLSACDLTIVADYGHGMLAASTRQVLCQRAPFLCVNVQTNAGNRGYNPISKYCRADYLCMNQSELDIETRQKHGDTLMQLKDVAVRIDCRRFAVTLGSRGILYLQSGESGYTTTTAPALADKIVDRVGAGDAVFAVTSLLVRLDAPAEVICFLGSAAGAYKTTYLGNAKALEREPFKEYVKELLG